MRGAQGAALRERSTQRGRRRGVVALGFLAGIALAAGIGACGSRSPLPIEGDVAASDVGGGPSRRPASASVGPGGADSQGGGGAVPSGGGGGAAPIDAGPDVLPPPDDCADAGATFIYAITANNDLLRYDPSPGTLGTIGRIQCNDANGGPFSMGVDRSGIAYVVFQGDGRLFRVSTASASCQPTRYTPNQLGWLTFGMAYASDDVGGGETLYVVESDYSNPSKGLGKIDTTAARLEFVAPVSPTLGDAIELTGTGDGRLYAFGLSSPGPGSHLAEIDKATGATLSDVALPVGVSTSAFAFAFYGGDFYLFTDQGSVEPNAPTTITRYRPSDGSLAVVGEVSDHVVGVGVSTCAPQTLNAP